jgi:hypothetical protein
MYSQKRNCAASLFTKQNHNGLSPNLHIMYLWEYINRSQVHECRNWERGRTVSFLRIYVSNFRYSVHLSTRLQIFSMELGI